MSRNITPACGQLGTVRIWFFIYSAGVSTVISLLKELFFWLGLFQKINRETLSQSVNSVQFTIDTNFVFIVKHTGVFLLKYQPIT